MRAVISSVQDRPPGTGKFRNLLNARAVLVTTAVAWLYWSAIEFLGTDGGIVRRLTADNALRLVQIRNLLAGQSWFDLTLYRMTPPDGVAMHWSRLVDAPIAGLIVILRVFTDNSRAEELAISIWPMLLLLPAWLALVRIADRLAGRRAGFAALFLAFGAIYMLGFFRVGEIDHHNVHVVLTLWTIALLLDFAESISAGIACAILSAVSLGVGLETLPYVLTACLIVSAYWIAWGKRVERQVRSFGLAFAGTSAALLFGAVAAHERFSASCDTFSGFYAVLAVAGGVGLAGLTTVPLRSTQRARATLVALLAMGLLAIVLGLAPQCASGPYHMISPELNRIWLSRVEEARSAYANAKDALGLFIMTYVYSLVGLALSVAAVFLVDKPRRTGAIIVAAFAFVAVAVSSLQIRGISFAVYAGVPGIAVALVRLADKFIVRGWLRALGLVTALVLLSQAAFAFVGNELLEGAQHSAARIEARRAHSACVGYDATRALAQLPAGRVAAFVFAAPAILLYTHHSVMAGSYHRDGKAIIDLYRFFTGTDQTSMSILRQYHIDYVMTCRRDGDYAYLVREGGRNGLLSRLDRGDNPGWLVALPSEDPVRIYKVALERP